MVPGPKGFPIDVIQLNKIFIILFAVIEKFKLFVHKALVGSTTLPPNNSRLPTATAAHPATPEMSTLFIYLFKQGYIKLLCAFGHTKVTGSRLLFMDL